MFFVSDALLDQILTDDIPYGDATTALLGIEKVPGIVRCRPKAETTIAGVALAERLFTRVGLQTTCFHEEGDTVDAGTVILEGRGPFWSTPQASPRARTRWYKKQKPEMPPVASPGHASIFRAPKLCRFTPRWRAAPSYTAWGYPNPFSCLINTASSLRTLKSGLPKSKKRIPSAKSPSKPPIFVRAFPLPLPAPTSSSVKNSPWKH